jgi:hypothetical protein
MKMRKGVMLVAAALAPAVLGAAYSTAAIIQNNANGDTDDTAVPNNTLALSVGSWDGGGGVVISSNSFVSAQHLDYNFNNGTFTLPNNGGNFTTVSHELIPNSDLVVWQIGGTFANSAIAPLYSGTITSEATKTIYTASYGYYKQGTPVTTVTNTGTVNNGWYWGGNTGTLNFGQHTIASVNNTGPYNSSMLNFYFTPGNDSIWAAQDSGGGAFIYNNGQYQLAGIAYGVTQYYSYDSSNSTYSPVNNAAIYDATGLYVYDSANSTYYPADAVGYQNQEGDASNIASYYSLIAQDASVPEPGTLALIGASGLLLLKRNRSETRPN